MHRRVGHAQKHLPSYPKRIALGKQPPSPVLILGQSEANVQPIDHNVPTHSKENEGVKDETQDCREEHLGWVTGAPQPSPDRVLSRSEGKT